MRDKDMRFNPAFVEEVIHRTLAEKRIVGSVVQIAWKGEVVYTSADGLADREQNRRMQENALFRYASVTKPIVSTAAMVLISEGKLKLDDPVMKWLPEFRPKQPNGEVASMTVHHLMTHTAGLTYRFFQENGGLTNLPEYQMGWISLALRWKKICRGLLLLHCCMSPGRCGDIRLQLMYSVQSLRK